MQTLECKTLERDLSDRDTEIESLRSQLSDAQDRLKKRHHQVIYGACVDLLYPASPVPLPLAPGVCFELRCGYSAIGTQLSRCRCVKCSFYGGVVRPDSKVGPRTGEGSWLLGLPEPSSLFSAPPHGAICRQLSWCVDIGRNPGSP